MSSLNEPGSSQSIPTVAILTGPTASGKTAYALEIAEASGDVEIINADSVIVYRHFNIGSAKPTDEELARVPHHLVNVRDPSASFTAGDFVRETRAALEDIRSRGHKALIVGGTGFYLKALLFGLWEAPAADAELRLRLEAFPLNELHSRLALRDPTAAARIGPKDRYRLIRACELLELTGKTPTELEAERPSEPDPAFCLLIIDREPGELDARIRTRVTQMLKQGLIDETRSLIENFPNARPLGSVGYSETVAFLEGRVPEGRKIASGVPGLEEEITLATRQLVKKQRTWFKSAPNAAHFRLDRDQAELRAALSALYPSRR